MDTEREHLSKLKKSTKALNESANAHYKNECQFAEILCQLGYVQDMNQDPQLGVAFTNFGTLVRALADLTYDRLFINFLSKNFLTTLKTVLSEDIVGAKNDAKKSFEKSFRDYEAKVAKAVQREKRQSLAADTGSVSGLTTTGASLLPLEDLSPLSFASATASAVHQELNEEKRALQLAMYEIGLNENESHAKRGVNVLTQLLEMYHVLRRFFREGLETVDQFASYIDSFALQLQQRRKHLNDERKALNDMRSSFQRNDSSLIPRSIPVSQSLLPETYSITTTTSTLTPSKTSLTMPTSSSSHNITYEQQHIQTTPLPKTSSTSVPTSNSSPGSFATAGAATAESAEYNLHQPLGDKRCGTQRQGYLMMKKLDSPSSISQSLKISLLYKRFVKRYVVVQDGNMLIVADPSHVAEAAAAATATINSTNSDSFSNNIGKKGSSHRHKTTIRLHLITCQAKPVVTTSSTSSANDNDEQCLFDVVSPRTGTVRFQASSMADRDIWLSVVRNSQQEALQTAFNDAPDDDDNDANDAGGGSADDLNDCTETECDFGEAQDAEHVDTVYRNTGHDRIAHNNLARGKHQSKKQRMVPAIKKFVLEELESNRTCCDCGAAVDATVAARTSQPFDPAKDVTWISTNFGIGVHVSRVQSLKLDRLSPAELLVAYALGGNRYFNCILEAKLLSTNSTAQRSAAVNVKKPTSATSMDEKRVFIQQKYVQRAFADASISVGAGNGKIADFLVTSFADVGKGGSSQNHLQMTDSNKKQHQQQYIVGGVNLSPLISAYAAGIDLAGRYFDSEQTFLHVLMREGDDSSCLPLVEFVVQNSSLSGDRTGGAGSSGGQHFSRSDADDNTPVHAAAMHDRSECLKLLLRAGADWKARNKRGRTAFDEATAAGHQRCADMLNEAKIGSQYYTTFSNVKYSWHLVKQHYHRQQQLQQARSKSVVSESLAAQKPSATRYQHQQQKTLLQSKNSTHSAPLLNEGGVASLAVPVLPSVSDDDEDDNELVIVDADHFKHDRLRNMPGGGAVSTMASPGGSLKPQRQDAATGAAAGGRIAFRALPPPRLDMLNTANTNEVGGAYDTPTSEVACSREAENDEHATASSSSSSILQHYLTSLRAGIRRRYSESPGRLVVPGTSGPESSANDGVSLVGAAAQHSITNSDKPLAVSSSGSSSASSSTSASRVNTIVAQRNAADISGLRKSGALIATKATISGHDKLESSTMPRRLSTVSNIAAGLNIDAENLRRNSAPNENKNDADAASYDLNASTKASTIVRKPFKTNNAGPFVGGNLVTPSSSAPKTTLSQSFSSGLTTSSDDEDDELDGATTMNEEDIDEKISPARRNASKNSVGRNGDVPPLLPPKLRRKARPLSLAVAEPTITSWLTSPVAGGGSLQSYTTPSPPKYRPAGGAYSAPPPSHHQTQYQRYQQQHYRPPSIQQQQLLPYVNNNNNTLRNGNVSAVNPNADIYSQPLDLTHLVRKSASSSSSSQFAPGDLVAIYAGQAGSNNSINNNNSGASSNYATMAGGRNVLPHIQRQPVYVTQQRYPARHASFFASPSATTTGPTTNNAAGSPAVSTKSQHHHQLLTAKLSSNSLLLDTISSLPRQRKSYAAETSTSSSSTTAADVQQTTNNRNNAATRQLVAPTNSTTAGCIMRCCALYDCVADRPDELSFRAGDIILVTREHTVEPMWMEGYVYGGPGDAAAAGKQQQYQKPVGLFPASFVYRLPDNS